MRDPLQLATIKPSKHLKLLRMELIEAVENDEQELLNYVYDELGRLQAYLEERGD